MTEEQFILCTIIAFQNFYCERNLHFSLIWQHALIFDVGTRNHMLPRRIDEKYAFSK